MEYEDIQEIAVIYGTKKKIKMFLDVNEQALNEEAEGKINLVVFDRKAEAFDDLKSLIWKGD